MVGVAGNDYKWVPGEPWASAMICAGYINPLTDLPSANALARAAGGISPLRNIHPSTVIRLIKGTNANRRGDQDLIDRIAAALDKNPETITEWSQQSWRGPDSVYEPPIGSEILTEFQRKAVTAIITSFIEQNQRRRPPSS